MAGRLFVLLGLVTLCYSECFNWPTMPPEWGGTFPPVTDWTWPTLPPGWSDWTPGSQFPTLGPSTTVMPPECYEEANVEIPGLGKIQGGMSFTSPVTAPRSRKFYWFAGIPYANPQSYAVKANRFKPSTIWDENEPLPVNNNGVFAAINPLIWCPQSDVLPLTMSLNDVLQSYKNQSKINKAKKAGGITPLTQGIESCLVINVNTPVLPKEGDPPANLPVIVFIHGGSFDLMWGGIFGGHRFLNRDVVLVTINYRLGILGSLNLGIDDAPGNAAMYDVVTALKWVNKYIHHFGGDKNSVTLTGHSAGSVMASHFLTSPLINDPTDGQLVHKIIGLSGSALSQWATCTDPMTHHLRVAFYAGCYDNATAPNPQVIRDCMANKEIDELRDALGRYSDQERLEGRLGFDAKVPSLQSESITHPRFIVDTPYNVMKKQEQAAIPVMMGATRHDGTFVMESTYEDFLLPNDYINDPIYLRNKFLPTLLESLGLRDPSGELIHSLANLYLGDAMNTDDFESKIPGLIDIHSVFGFKAGAYSMVEMNSKKTPSYYFAFEYWGSFSVDGGDVIPGGIGHIDSIFYLFQANPLIIPKDQDVAYRFTDFWVNFATYGNPNGDSQKTVASPYNPINHAYLIIGNYDRTGYYVRDSWVDNSLEIMGDGTTTEVSGATSSVGSSEITTEGPTTEDGSQTPSTATTPKNDQTTASSSQAGINITLVFTMIYYAIIH